MEDDLLVFFTGCSLISGKCPGEAVSDAVVAIQLIERHREEQADLFGEDDNGD